MLIHTPVNTYTYIHIYSHVHMSICTYLLIQERLEIKYQAIRDSYIANVTQFTTDKREHENYFRALQSIFIRLLRVHMYYNKQTE